MCRRHRDQIQEHVDGDALLLVHGCAEARDTATVEGWAPYARGLLHHPQLPCVACWSQNETKTSLVLGDDDAEWEHTESWTPFDLF